MGRWYLSFFFFYLLDTRLEEEPGQGKNARKAWKHRTYRSVSFEGTDDLDVILCVCIRLNVRLVLIWFQSLPSYTTAPWKAESSAIDKYDSKYVLMTCNYNLCSSKIIALEGLTILHEDCKCSTIPWVSNVIAKCMLMLINQSEIAVRNIHQDTCYIKFISIVSTVVFENKSSHNNLDWINKTFPIIVRTIMEYLLRYYVWLNHGYARTWRYSYETWSMWTLYYFALFMIRERAVPSTRLFTCKHVHCNNIIKMSKVMRGEQSFLKQ